MPSEANGSPLRTVSAKPKAARPTAVGARAWEVAQQLRARRGWFLDQADLGRSWSIRVGSLTFELSAHVSFFFDDSGFVLSLTPTFRKGTRRKTKAEVVQSVRALFGERYRTDPLGDSVWTKLRTDEPAHVFAEIEHVERVLGGPSAKRIRTGPRSQDGRRWHIVNTLRSKSWHVGSLTFSRKVGDRAQQIWPSIGVLVDSATGRPGLSANFAAWVPEPNERWTKFSDDTTHRLTANGFTLNEKEPRSFQAGRWIPGLSGARALKQAQAFDHLVGLGVGSFA
jgi:hypothetical protein